MSRMDAPDLSPRWATTEPPRRNDDLPRLALSVRQPWAYAIMHLGKDIENRTRGAIDLGGMCAVVGQRIAIHAGIGMTRDEYESAADTIRAIGHRLPPPAELQRGGIVGTVEVTDLVTLAARARLDEDARAAISPWFFGPWGLRLARPRPVPFVRAKGQLGIFAWQPSGEAPHAPAKWMLPKEEKPASAGRTRRPGPGATGQGELL